MDEIAYVLKLMVITIVIVLMMQIKIGKATIEDHGYAFLRQSILVEQLQSVADGGIQMMSRSYHALANVISSRVGKKPESSPGQRKAFSMPERYNKDKEKSDQ